MVLSIFIELFNYHHNQLYFFKIYYLNLFKFYYYLFFYCTESLLLHMGFL